MVVTFVVDAFWGSSGKGKLCAWLAHTHTWRCASSNNLPNAGHTVRAGGRRYVFKSLPSASIVPVLGGEKVDVFLGPGSGISPSRFLDEWNMVGRPRTIVHARAMVWRQEHRDEETIRQGLRAISSTQQGSGAMLAEKLWREARLVGDGEQITTLVGKMSHEEREDYFHKVRYVSPSVFWKIAREESCRGWVHEVAQGMALSLDWGTHYPFCTSRNCTVSQAAADLGLLPTDVGDIYLNVRSFPIRVGNLPAGYSGDFCSDSQEISLENILHNAGVPEEEKSRIYEIETTTVTGRARRLSTISWDWLKESAAFSGATHLVLNFAQYLDWRDYRCIKKTELSKTTRTFVERMEQTTGLPVVWVGTGPDHYHWTPMD